MADFATRKVRGCRVRCWGPDAERFLRLMAAKTPVSEAPAAPARSRVLRGEASGGPRSRRRARIRALARPDRTIAEIALLADVPYIAAWRAVRALDLPHLPGVPRGDGRKHDGTIREMALRGCSSGQIARRTGMTLPGVWYAIERLGLRETWRSLRAARRAPELQRAA